MADVSEQVDEAPAEEMSEEDRMAAEWEAMAGDDEADPVVAARPAVTAMV